MSSSFRRSGDWTIGHDIRSGGKRGFTDFLPTATLAGGAVRALTREFPTKNKGSTHYKHLRVSR